MSGAHRTFCWKIEDVHVALREVCRENRIFSHQQEQNKRWHEVDNFAWKWSTILLFVVALVSVALLKALTSRRTWRFLSDLLMGKTSRAHRSLKNLSYFFSFFQQHDHYHHSIFHWKKKSFEKNTGRNICPSPKKKSSTFPILFPAPGYEAPDVQRLRMSQRPFESWFGTRSRRRQNVTSVIFLGGKRWNKTRKLLEKRYSRMQYLS